VLNAGPLSGFHYMRFKDQMGLAADGRKRLKLVTPEG
jgi:hypothetical protein